MSLFSYSNLMVGPYQPINSRQESKRLIKRYQWYMH